MSNIESRTKVIVAVIGLLGIVIGTFGNQIYNEYFTDTILPANNLGYTEQQNGLYVFFRCRPQNNNYQKLGTITTNSVFKAIENTKGKKKLGDILGSVANSLVSDFSFDNRLSDIIDKVKTDYPNAEGIIFSDDLTQCDVVKF